MNEHHTIMEMHNGVRYTDNYARAAASFLSTCAPEPDGEARKAAYRLITSMYTAIANNAQALGYKPSEDVSFAPWEQQAERQKDVKTIRGTIEKVDALAAELFALAEAGEACVDGLRLPQGVLPKRAMARVLAMLGAQTIGGTINLPAPCASGLKELAHISRANAISVDNAQKEDKAHLYFSRCVFEPAQNWIAPAFDKLLCSNGQFIYLCNELEKRGYTRVDCRDGRRVSIDYVKQHGNKPQPVKQSWADKTHSGIEATYEDLRLEPCFVWLRMPEYKTVLARADEMPKDVLDFLMNHTKNCNGCRYCVQTDKTGTRPLAAVSVANKKKCPYYPSFGMNWRALPPELVRNILAAIDDVDGILA